MVNQIRSLISFLTILPIGKNYDIYYVARNMFLFPVAGAIIGLLIGSFALGLSMIVQPLFVGLIAIGALFILTGAHHTDALSDFADGLMAKGGKNSKRKAMSDPRAGSAGTAALVLYFAGSVIAVSMLAGIGGFKLLMAIVVSEVIAKYVMVVQAHKGIGAWEGVGSPFTEQMKSKMKFLTASAIALPVAYFAGGLPGLYALGAAIIIAFVLLRISNRSFGGVSGDVFGASNEITRLSSLMILASIL
ncbi:MAG: adenosylcobinamide-GDP ribazoletransferase [Nitrososphaerales archaeon]